MEIILFFIVFLLIIIVGCISIIKTENSVNYKKEATQRQKLELENTEYDYGHNINYNSEEE